MARWSKKWSVPSDSDPEKIYTVSQDEHTGEWGCSCPAWTRRRIECKHIKSVKAGRITGGRREMSGIDPEDTVEIEEADGLALMDAPDLSDMLGGPTKEERTKEDRRPLLERLKDTAPWRFNK